MAEQEGRAAVAGNVGALGEATDGIDVGVVEPEADVEGDVGLALLLAELARAVTVGVGKAARVAHGWRREGQLVAEVEPTVGSGTHGQTNLGAGARVQAEEVGVFGAEIVVVDGDDHIAGAGQGQQVADVAAVVGVEGDPVVGDGELAEERNLVVQRGTIDPETGGGRFSEAAATEGGVLRSMITIRRTVRSRAWRRMEAR